MTDRVSDLSDCTKFDVNFDVTFDVNSVMAAALSKDKTTNKEIKQDLIQILPLQKSDSPPPKPKRTDSTENLIDKDDPPLKPHFYR